MSVLPHVLVKKHLAERIGMTPERMMNFLLCVSPLTLEEAACIESKTKGELTAKELLRLQRFGVAKKRYNFRKQK